MLPRVSGAKKSVLSVCQSFLNEQPDSFGNTESTGCKLFYIGLLLARWGVSHDLWITDGGRKNRQIQFRLRCLGAQVIKKQHYWILDRHIWDGSPIELKSFKGFSKDKELSILRVPWDEGLKELSQLVEGP